MQKLSKIKALTKKHSKRVLQAMRKMIRRDFMQYAHIDADWKNASKSILILNIARDS